MVNIPYVYLPGFSTHPSLVFHRRISEASTLMGGLMLYHGDEVSIPVKRGYIFKVKPPLFLVGA